MLIPYLFRSLVFPFPSSLRRAFHLLHSTYIHSYAESMNLTKRPPKLGSMKLGSSLRVIILALLKMEHLQRFALDFPCPKELYEYISDSQKLKQLTWTDLASKVNMMVPPRCRLEAIEFSDMGMKCEVPVGLIIESTPTLKTLSVHSSWYIYILLAFVHTCAFPNLASFTFSSMNGHVEPRPLQGILESCPSITTLHLPTPLQWVVFLSPGALPRLNTLDAGPNEFVLGFLEGRPVRRLFASPVDGFSLTHVRQYLQNCSFSLLHVEIEYSYAEEFFKAANRTLIYCEDLALDVRVGSRTVCHFITSTIPMSHLTLVQPGDVAVTTLVTWLTAPSLVDLSLTIRMESKDYVEEVLNMVELQRDSEIRLRDVCGGSPNLQQMTVEYCLSTQTERGFHARRLNEGEWVVRSTLGMYTSTSWYHAGIVEAGPAETEEGYGC